MASEEYSMTPPLTPGIPDETAKDALDYIDMLDNVNIIPSDIIEGENFPGKPEE